MLIVSILGIRIDGTLILLSLFQEVEFDDGFMSVLIAFTTDEPTP